MPLISTTTIRQDPAAIGPIKIKRNAKGVPILGPNGKTIPLGANDKPVAKGGKRKTLNKRKTRKARRYSRRR
jgi:hypothetical protein